MKNTILGLTASLVCLCCTRAQNTTEALAAVPGQENRILIHHAGQDLLTDSDGDGIPDSREAELGTDSFSPDTDGDGYLDAWEENYGLDPSVFNDGVRLMYVPITLSLPEGYVGGEIVELSEDWAAGYVWNESSDVVSARWNLKTGAVEAAGGAVDTFTYGLNNSGVVVGTYNNREGMVWPVGAPPQRLGIVENHIFFARDVNAANLVVGRENSFIAGTGAFYWQSPGDPAGNFGHLDAPDGFRSPIATAINDRGQIAGSAQHLMTGIRHGVIWDNFSPRVVSTLSGLFEIEQVTNSGKLIGRRGSNAVIWSEAHGLNFLPSGDFSGTSQARKMNAGGEIIGTIDDRSILWRPIADNQWEPIEIGDEIDDPEIAFGYFHTINDRGEIAGSVDTIVGTRPVLLVPTVMPTLAVDNDHDGLIELVAESEDDRVSIDRPFAFWVNDDDDSGEVRRSSEDDIPRLENNSGRDSANLNADGVRDLEDFFPVLLNIKQLLGVLPAGTSGISYHLRHAGNALGVIFTRLGRANAFEYLRGVPAKLATGYGPSLAQAAGQATVTALTATGIDLAQVAPAFMSRLAEGQGGVILVEAMKATAEPLILEVRRGGEVLIELKLDLKISAVETMFTYYNLRSLANGSEIDPDRRGPNYGVAIPELPVNDPFLDEPERKNLIFLHGYNVNGHEARGWAISIFKRLHWAGSKAKFAAVLWRGDDGQGAGIVPDSVTADYHRNVGHAWQQGMHFRDLLNGFSGETAVLAHSLGNMVAMAALTHERATSNPEEIRPAARPSHVLKYFAVNAAIPLEALSTADITAEAKSKMRHHLWRNYQERLWPTEWHALFDPVDGRSRITWKSIFSGLDIGTNFHSTGEDVLENPKDDSMPLLEPVLEGIRAWVAQEKSKGGSGITSTFFRSNSGGWGVNTAWYGDFAGRLAPLAGFEATELRVPSSALPEQPFFKRFQASEFGNFYPGYDGSRLMAPRFDPNADRESRKLVTIAKCLGEAIPAISFALGRNKSSKFERPALSGNFELDADFNSISGNGFRNGWPRQRTMKGDVPAWRHSDCVAVAFLHVFPLFDQITAQMDQL